MLYAEIGGYAWDGNATGALDLAVDSGLYPSRGEARRAIAQNGLSINGVRITAPEAPTPDPIAGRYLLLRAGRKRLVVARREG